MPQEIARSSLTDSPQGQPRLTQKEKLDKNADNIENFLASSDEKRGSRNKPVNGQWQMYGLVHNIEKLRKNLSWWAVFFKIWSTKRLLSYRYPPFGLKHPTKNNIHAE